MKIPYYKVGVAFVLYAAVVLIASCNPGNIKVESKTPVTFNLSGNETVQLFQVTAGDALKWRIGPKGNPTLSEMGRVVYGETPASCWQTVPSSAAAPTFV